MEQDICFHVFLWQIVTKPIGTISIKVKLTLCIKDNKSIYDPYIEALCHMDKILY